MDKSEFLKASERAEQWVRQIKEVREWIDSDGDPLIAWGFLRQLEFKDEPWQRDSVLEGMDDQLAAIADNVLEHEWGGNRRHYTSVHQLVDDTRRWLYVHFVMPLMTADDKMRRTETTRLIEKHHGIFNLPPVTEARLQRERARLVSMSSDARDFASDTPADPPRNKSAKDSSPNSDAASRRRSTKHETTVKVNAAIALKIQHPDWSESQCAKGVGLSPSTLNGKSEWAEWRKKIEAAHSQGRMAKVKMAFDRRIGESVIVDPNS